MEALHEVVVGELQHPSQQIVKGKRTKRQRPSSPIPFTVAHAHSPSGEGVAYSSNVDNTTWENNNNSNNDNNQNDSNQRLSLGGSSEDAKSTTTEEEDVARVLILLSQGCSRESPIKNDYLDHNYYPPSPKFTSKKYIETSTNANVKSGMFVYECKTCNRTFSSFQALGGHRASHKKYKNLLASEEIKKRHVSSVFRYDYDYDFNPSSSISFSRSNSYSNLTSYNSTTSNKIHECFYCGAEFTSGQALGGHMRRHRGSNGNNNNAYKYYYQNNIHNIQPLSSLRGPLPVNEQKMGVNKDEIENDNKDALPLSLSLDLNLPAQNDQKNQESTNFQFVTKKISPSSPPHKPNEQQQTDNNNNNNNSPDLLCNTTPTLLNCHD